MNRDELVSASTEAIRKGSRSFAMAARLFDRQTREHCVMLYAWCRHCDDEIDGQQSGHGARPLEQAVQEQRLATLRQQTHEAAAGRPGDEPVFRALASVVADKRIPSAHLDELLDGFSMDVWGRRYRDLGDVLDYSYHVAGVVGVMTALIMQTSEASSLDRAADLGIAFQLTNIARDVMDDARTGRVYLPADWLAEEGIDRIEPDDPAQRARVYRAALRLLDEAEPYYRSALAGLADLPWQSTWAVASARRIYRAIGTSLRRQGPEAWNRRVATTPTRKLVLAVLALGDVIASRILRDRADRAGLYRRPDTHSAPASVSAIRVDLRPVPAATRGSAQGATTGSPVSRDARDGSRN